MFTAVWVDWRRHLAIAGVALVALGGLGIGAYFLVDSLRGDGDQVSSAPAPRVVVHEQQPQTVEDLGFPAFATKNTTRVAGSDPVADAAGVALAVFPSTGGVEGPAAVTLVNGDDWASGIAAASLMAPPVGAPILITSSDATPDLTANALDALSPPGSAATDDHQAFAVGSAAAPSGLRTVRVSGEDPAELAAATERFAGHAGWRAAAARPPRQLGEARVLDARRGLERPVRRPRSLRGPGYRAEAHAGRASPPEGGARVRTRAARGDLGQGAGTGGQGHRSVKRIGADDPVQNAIDFARYVDGTFGWNVSDPGHGFVIANESRPLDAAAAAALSASGDWGPLLLTDDPTQVSGALRSYLLDVKPGYVSDPTRAVYNHVWLIGDQEAISVGFQAQVDELAEVAQVRSGSGPTPSAPSGRPEHEPSGPSKP